MLIVIKTALTKATVCWGLVFYIYIYTRHHKKQLVLVLKVTHTSTLRRKGCFSFLTILILEMRKLRFSHTVIRTKKESSLLSFKPQVVSNKGRGSVCSPTSFHKENTGIPSAGICYSFFCIIKKLYAADNSGNVMPNLSHSSLIVMQRIWKEIF